MTENLFGIIWYIGWAKKDLPCPIKSCSYHSLFLTYCFLLLFYFQFYFRCTVEGLLMEKLPDLAFSMLSQATQQILPSTQNSSCTLNSPMSITQCKPLPQPTPIPHQFWLNPNQDDLHSYHNTPPRGGPKLMDAYKCSIIKYYWLNFFHI